MNTFTLDPSNAHRKAYFEKLNNQISVTSGYTISVYDRLDDIDTALILSSQIQL